MEAPLKLWSPENAEESACSLFMTQVNSDNGISLKSYADVYNWSIEHLDLFWAKVWDFGRVIGAKGTHVVDNSAFPAKNPAWFSQARVNWAENMLSCRSKSRIALIEAVEPTPETLDPPLRQCTYLELYGLVADIVSALLLNGMKPGDRIASYSSNCIDNVAVCLACAAIGCIWVAAASDFAPAGVNERFEQVEPRIIFAVDQVVYNGKLHDHIPKLASLVSLLGEKDIHPKVVVFHATAHQEERARWHDSWIAWDDFVQQGKDHPTLGRTADGEIEWSLQSFDWPLWILFSSGTTGKPKPIVHRAGGMLLQMKKEFILGADLKPDDIFFYYTTTGWMMFNFHISALTTGCTLVLYDGSPLKVPSYLWKLVDQLGITIFGTSAKYLDELSKRYNPREHHNLGTLRHIYSTGSPLSPSLYDYVYKHVHTNVLLASITGGTDICSLFAGMSTMLPVYRGEIQCRMLGMAIESYTSAGTPAPPDTPGELVCVRPFPCMPLGFWPLPGFGPNSAVAAAQTRFQQAYFDEYPNVWYHGDHVIIAKSRDGNAGGVVMLGRSDGVLNPQGVRFGTAELYEVLDLYFSKPSDGLPAITDYMAVCQVINGGTDERVILFVKIAEGETLTPHLEATLRSTIRLHRSPRHVPAKIMQVQDIPSTLNGKRIEVLVKKIINGAPVSSVNLATLRNPDGLEEYVEIAEILRREVN